MSVWFITGCSSGFGAHLAHLALTHGHHVIATSRAPHHTPSLVSSIESRGGHWLALDVCSGADELARVLEHALAIYGRIDVLVNSAGASILGAVEDISDAEARRVMETNFWGPLSIMRGVLPGMRERRCGTIVNFSSTAGQVALPAVGVYAASKHALEAISESLSHELRPLGIRVLIIQPGGFNTSFAASIAQPASPMTADYAQTPVAAVLRSVPGLAGHQFGDVEKGCRAIFDVVTRSGLGLELGRRLGDGDGDGDGDADADADADGEKGNGRGEEYLRIPLGTDCARRLKGQFDSFQRGLEGTRRIWESTDVEDKEGDGNEGRERLVLDFGK